MKFVTLLFYLFFCSLLVSDWLVSNEYICQCKLFLYLSSVRITNSWARIKPTAPLSAFDKKNSIEFLLDLLYYIYNYYHGYAPCLPQSSYPSGDSFVTSCDYDLWLHYDMTMTWPFCDYCHTFVTLWLVMW